MSRSPISRSSSRPHGLRPRIALRSSLVSVCLLGLGVSAALPARSEPETTPRNRASFQVEAVREIPNDWTTARLSVIAEGKEPAAIANEVNTAMAKAVARAKRTKGIEVQSGAYVTHPIYDSGRVVRWQASQELRLEAGNVDRLAKLIGELQSDSVLLSGIEFSVRRETRKALEDELITEALAAFRQRAGLIANNMLAKNWSLIDVSVGSTEGSPRRVTLHQRETSMMSKSQAVSATFEAGTSELRVQASGVIELD